MTSKLRIAFADLTYTNQGFSSVTFPFGASLVASYSKKIFEDNIKVELFKYPDDLKKYLENKRPCLVGFSDYSWTDSLSHGFAHAIKKKYPNTVIVFGGPNFPLEREEQKKFLIERPAIDFYIRGEGEKSFSALVQALEINDFDAEKLRRINCKIPNCYYINDNKLVEGEMLPRLENLDEIPSPYLSGMMDKFFDGILNPAIQTTRGCPFKCTYCQEGQDYFCKISRFSYERLRQDLEYIAQRTKMPNLQIADSNFGRYKEDIKTCEIIAEIKEKYKWPKYFDASFGKNKEGVLKAVRILEGGFRLSAPVQSTDEQVLKNIQRKNISIDEIVEMTRAGEVFGTNSLSEVILCLPGDTRKAHYKSMLKMIDAGINVVRAHQLLMLPGSEISTKDSRDKFNMNTRFRLQPRCFQEYELFDKKLSAMEIDEICVSNNTMSYEDYLACRDFDLSVELFYNNDMSQEPIELLIQKNISPSELIIRVNEKSRDIRLKEIYEGFLKETENSLWKNKSELEKHLRKPRIIEEYITKGLRSNEQLRYRAQAFFTKMPELQSIIFESTDSLIEERHLMDEKTRKYIDELHKFNLLRKNDLLSIDRKDRGQFHFDFPKLLQSKFKDNPLEHFLEGGIEIEFYHSWQQKETIFKYLKQFGNTFDGLGLVLSWSHIDRLYREIRVI